MEESLETLKKVKNVLALKRDSGQSIQWSGIGKSSSESSKRKFLSQKTQTYNCRLGFVIFSDFLTSKITSLLLFSKVVGDGSIALYNYQLAKKPDEVNSKSL